MTDNAPLLALAEPMIKADEACRLKAYLDTRGIPTIGWGRADIGVRMGMTCTQTQADGWFAAKIEILVAALDHSIGWWRGLNLARQAVLLDMAYQLGVRGLMEFRHTLAAIRAGYFDRASAGMLESAWADETPRRAAREAAIMKSGTITA